jgi:hypothetical protein
VIRRKRRRNSTLPGGSVTKAGKDQYRRLARQVRQKIKTTFFAKVEFQ